MMPMPGILSNIFQAMKAQGINIYAVTPQNEPLNPNNNSQYDHAGNRGGQFYR